MSEQGDKYNYVLETVLDMADQRQSGWLIGAAALERHVRDGLVMEGYTFDEVDGLFDRAEVERQKIQQELEVF